MPTLNHIEDKKKHKCTSLQAVIVIGGGISICIWAGDENRPICAVCGNYLRSVIIVQIKPLRGHLAAQPQSHQYRV